MTRIAGPDCAVMCSLINIYIHAHTHTARAFNKKSSPLRLITVAPRAYGGRLSMVRRVGKVSTTVSWALREI